MWPTQVEVYLQEDRAVNPASCHPEKPNYGKGLCVTCYRRNWYKHRSDSERERARLWHRAHANEVAERRQKIRTGALAIFGSKCVRCGFDDTRALQVDHINGGGSRERRLLTSQSLMRRLYKGMSPIGYQCLCANCNWIKRTERQECN